MLSLLTNYILPRLGAFLLVVFLTFFLMKVLPGDPFNDEQALPKEIHQALRVHYGLDKPAYEQFLLYAKGLFKGDLGPSFRFKDQNVQTIIAKSFPTSFLLGMEALSLAVSSGILLGLLSAYSYNTWLDKSLFVGCSVVMAFPGFILGALLQYELSLQLGLFPIARWESLVHTLLPALALAALPAAFMARLVRSQVIDILKQDYMRTARMKGLSEWRIFCVHALRPALLPLVTYLGPVAANILVGSFAVETIFAIPGLGQWFVTSILSRDYTVLMGITLFYSAILLCMLTLVDGCIWFLDPRLRRRAFAA